MKLVEAPRLWGSDAAGHRRVTWMELFFDLIFVAAVAEVGKPLADEYSPAGLMRYTFLFVLIWWAWSGHTLYCTRFDHDDAVQRGLVLLQCFIAAVMAANAGDALDSRSSAGFGAAYAGMRVVLVVQYLRARRVPETRALTTWYAFGFAIAAAFWIVSALVEVPYRYWVWAAALAIDFTTPWLAAKHSLRFPPDAAHFPERFGLFTIILLGEFVASVMRGIASQEYWSFAAATTAFAGMAFAFVLRWWYFDVAESAEERHIRSRRQGVLFQVWHYAHLPMFLGIGVAGVGFEHLIGGELHKPEAAVLCAAVAVLMAALLAIGATSQSAQRRGPHGRLLWAQIAVAGAAAAIAPAGLPLVGLATALLALCVVEGLLGRQRLQADAKRLPSAA